MTFKDNSAQVKAQMAGNVKAALAAMGVEAVGLTVKQMEHGYTEPHATRDMMGRKTGGTHTNIRWHGDLERDVSSEVNGNVVNVGNSLEYSLFVHEGTSKLNGRPYLKDAVMNGQSRLKQVAENELKKGF